MRSRTLDNYTRKAHRDSGHCRASGIHSAVFARLTTWHPYRPPTQRLSALDGACPTVCPTERVADMRLRDSQSMKGVIVTTSTTTQDNAAIKAFQQLVAALDALPLETPLTVCCLKMVVTVTSHKQEAGN